MLLFCFIIQGFYVFEILATKRHWLSDIDYNNPDNWNVGHVPCETDRVIFPDNMEFAVELSSEAATRELVLPNTGEILLSTVGELTITDQYYNSSHCRGEDAEFKNYRALYWVDANNWDGWNPATPHIERIPCRTDRVVFPDEGTFSVVMPWDTVQIAGLTIKGQEMDTLSWDEFSKSEVGLEQFSKSNSNPGNIEISSELAVCKPSGCECSNEYIESSVCNRIRSCEMTKCLNPVRPKGHCCDICGALLFFSFNRSLRLSKLNAKLQEVVQQSNWPIIWHLSKYNDVIQLVLVEKDKYSGDIDEISGKLNEILIKDNLGLLGKSIQSSGPLYYPVGVGQVLERCLLSMIAACVIIAGIFLYYYSNTMFAVRRAFSSENRPFLFARFENQSGEMRLRNVSQRSLSIVSLPQAFDNPMYGSASQVQRDITVENPTYTELIKEEEEAEEITEIEIKEDVSKEEEKVIMKE